MSSFEEEFPNEPNPSDPDVVRRLHAVRMRMYNDLAMHLPDDWLTNANAKNRTEFKQHMLTSRTMAEIVEIVSWTMLRIEKEEENARARSQE